MLVRSLVLTSLLVLGSTAAYAESESNNLAAVEVPAGTGVYYSTVQPVQLQAQAQAPGRSTEVAQAPAARR